MSKIHQKSRSGQPLWGMKVSQQREDWIYFIAWLKSIWCVRCWRWRDEMSNGRLLSISSSLTTEWVQRVGESWLWQLHDSMTHNMWHWKKITERSSDVLCHAKQYTIIRWLFFLTWYGNDHSFMKTNNPSCHMLHARLNSLNPISCFHSICKKHYNTDCSMQQVLKSDCTLYEW